MEKPGSAPLPGSPSQGRSYACWPWCVARSPLRCPPQAGLPGLGTPDHPSLSASPPIATEYHLGLLKAKLAKYRAQLLEPSKSASSKGEGFDVMKSGDARVALIGFPSVGKVSARRCGLGAGGQEGGVLPSSNHRVLPCPPILVCPYHPATEICEHRWGLAGSWGSCAHKWLP